MRRLLLSLLAALALLAAAAGAGAAPIVSLQDDDLFNAAVDPDPNRLEQRLDMLAETGVKVTRVDILWAQVAPTRPADPRDPADPAYRWGPYDRIFRGLDERGIQAIADFYQTPRWASRSGDLNAAPRAADGAAFAGAIARRYNGAFPDPPRGALPEVRRIEVWNEPNIGQFYAPQCRRQGRRVVLHSPRTYAALLKASHREIKRANPRAIVVAGALGPVSSTGGCDSSDSSVGTVQFLERLAAEKPPLDAVSQHLYPIGLPDQAYFVPSWSSIPRLQRLIDRIRRGAPIYVTETGYHTSYNRFHRYFVSEAQQARAVDETWRVASRYPRVQIAVWFNMQDNPFWTGGLLRADGTRKPSYDRFAALARAQGPLPPAWAPGGAAQ